MRAGESGDGVTLAVRIGDDAYLVADTPKQGPSARGRCSWLALRTERKVLGATPTSAPRALSPRGRTRTRHPDAKLHASVLGAGTPSEIDLLR